MSTHQKDDDEPDNRPREFYTVKEFCRRNSISRPWFYKLVKAGVFQIGKYGSKTLVPAEAETIWRERVMGNGIRTHKISHKTFGATHKQP